MSRGVVRWQQRCVFYNLFLLSFLLLVAKFIQKFELTLKLRKKPTKTLAAGYYAILCYSNLQKYGKWFCPLKYVIWIKGLVFIETSWKVRNPFFLFYHLVQTGSNISKRYIQPLFGRVQDCSFFVIHLLEIEICNAEIFVISFIWFLKEQKESYVMMSDVNYPPLIMKFPAFTLFIRVA